MGFFEAHVLQNDEVSAGYALLSLGGCGALSGARPGQFVMLRGDWDRDPVLPRAYSILGASEGRARFLVKQVGRGSRLLGSAVAGARVTVLGPLGNGFPPPAPGAGPDLLVAGGCGLPPLHLAAIRATEGGTPGAVELLLGARCAAELPRPLLEELGGRDVAVSLATEDGSDGARGLVTDLLERRLAVGRAGRVLACGPTGMLRAVRDVTRRHNVPCLLSLEAEMACGLGACLGCAVEGRERRYLHVCSDGPVFDAEEVWP